MMKYAAQSIANSNGHAPEAPFVPLASRLNQLRAAISEAIDKTSGLTRYSHRDVPQPDEAAPSLLDIVDQMSRMMADLNQRLGRVNDVVGGTL